MMRPLKALLVALVALLTLMGGLMLGAIVIVGGLMAAVWRHFTGTRLRPPAARTRAHPSGRRVKRVAASEVTVRDVASAPAPLLPDAGPEATSAAEPAHTVAPPR